MLQLKDICKSFGSKTVLDNINEIIYDGEKIGIVGSNGQGKSTLLNIITGKDRADSGEVVSNEKIGFLEQSSAIEFGSLLNKLTDAEFSQEFFKQLKKLGFTKQIEWTLERIKLLSCGERTKIALASVLAINPTMLILDEPTNHLDIEGKAEIVREIQNFAGSVLVVSHDIDLLNQTVFKIWQVKDGKVSEFFGNYDDYKTQIEEKKLEIKRNYDKHKKRVAEIQEDIAQYKHYAGLADARRYKHKADRLGLRYSNGLEADIRSTKLSKRAAHQISRLEQELKKDVETPEKEFEIKYFLNTGDLKAKNIIFAENLTKKFGGNVLFENANFLISSGDKIGIIGANGTGKSTFLDIILGKTDYTGKLFITPSLKIVRLKQDVYDLDEDMTINEMSRQFDGQYRTDFIKNLVSMNIDKKIFDTKIRYLSSGERMRIKLCQIILSDANAIMLDEPTNHLDIENKQYLEKILSGFAGTIFIVSHDIDFLKHTTNRTFEIKDKKIIVK